MKDITPKREREAWRGKPTQTEPWEKIAAYWSNFAADMPQLEPLHRFVQTIASSPLSSSVFGRITWHGIALSDTPDFRSTDNTLEIDYFTPGGHFEFRHRTFSGNDDRKMVKASEALETLRLFLKYKYGVLIKIPEAESTRRDDRPPCTHAT